MEMFDSLARTCPTRKGYAMLSAAEPQSGSVPRFDPFHITISGWTVIAKRYPTLRDLGGRSILQPPSPARRLEGPIIPRVWSPTRIVRGVEWRWWEGV